MLDLCEKESHWMSLEKLKRYVIVQEFTLTVGRFLLGFKRLFIVSSEIVAPVTTSLSLLSIFQGAISALASCHDGYVMRSPYFLSLSFFLRESFFRDSICFFRSSKWDCMFQEKQRMNYKRQPD